MEMAKLFAEVLKAQSAQQERILLAVAASAENSTKAALSSAQAIQNHLDLFKVNSAPEARIIRDADEYREEIERLQAQGLIPMPTGEQQSALKALDNHLDIEALQSELGI